VALLVCGLTAAVETANRRWQNGVWSARLDDQTLALETDDVRLELRALHPQSIGPLNAKPGARATFAIEGATVYVRDSKGGEHVFRLARSIDKNYTGVGGGHLLRAVTNDGAIVTLEDGSTWDVSPSDLFKAVRWEPGAVMSVTKLRGDDGFRYELDNVDVDEGVQANYRVKSQ
jgi:hypothetical protein